MHVYLAKVLIDSYRNDNLKSQSNQWTDFDSGLATSYFSNTCFQDLIKSQLPDRDDLVLHRSNESYTGRWVVAVDCLRQPRLALREIEKEFLALQNTERLRQK